jgi:putative tricarboxylic transport membrane protein
MASDRIFGLVLVAAALAYIASALQIQTSFLSDPVGSKTFPILTGSIVAICGLVMIVRPDPDPDWPDARTFLHLGFAAVVLVAYAYALRPYGFLAPTALAAALLAYQITPRAGLSALTGVALSVGLFVIFRYGLGLGLQPFPKGLFG